MTGRARTRTAPGPGHRRRSRSPTGSTCGRTSPRPSRSASPPTAPAWPSPAPGRPGRTGPGAAGAGDAPARARREVRRAHPAAPRPGPRAARRRARAARDRPPPGLGPAHRPALDRAATWQELVDGRWKGPRPSKLDPFKPYLDQHADGGHGSIRRLFLEIQALGYDGSYPVVRDYLTGTAPPGSRCPAPPTVRDVTNWLCRRPDTLTEDEKPRLKAILDRCPELQAASDQVRAFAAMITGLTGQNLPQWIAAARTPACPASRRSPRAWSRTSTPSPTA